MSHNPDDFRFTSWDKYWDKKEMVTVPDRGQFNVYSNETDKSPFTIICVHGAGHSALSFSLMGAKLKRSLSMYAYDLKCHGDTPGDESTDMDIDNMVADCIGLCQVIHPEHKRLILVGHSLGGAIIAQVALKLHVSSIVAIDTIEGNVISSLPAMKQILLQRPAGFRTDYDACLYISSAGELENFESASVSAQGRLKKDDEGNWVWRTDLIKCEHSWEGWFKGFADAYIKSNPYKVLILPDINRLDTPFTIGHMSGKFQLEVVLNTNHCIHEDSPDHVAQILTKMCARIGSTHQWD